MPLRLHALRIVSTSLLMCGALLLAEPNAEACLEPSPPSPNPTKGPTLKGLFSVVPRVSGNLARDGGVLFEVVANELSPDEVLARVRVKVEHQGRAIAGELRAVTLPVASEVALPALHFRPSEDLPVGTLALTWDFDNDSGDTRDQTRTISIEVADARVRDRAVPRFITLESHVPSLLADTTSELTSCFVEGGRRNMSDSCGGSPSVTKDHTTMVPTRAKQVRSLQAKDRGEYRYGAASYYSTRARITWATGELALGSVTDVAPLPDGVDGRVCLEIHARSEILDDEQSTSFCTDVAPLVPLTQAQQNEWFRQRTTHCDSVGDDGGCSVQRGAAPSNTTLLTPLALALLALGRKRRPSR